MHIVIGFGIIGCGMISRWHANAVLSIEGARLAGATDVSKESREAFGREFGIPVYNSVDEMLSSPDIHVVSICTPSGLHTPLAIKAARAGKHIVVEKPMSINLKECDELIEAVEENRVKLTVISQLRFSPAVARIKEAVERGALGRLLTGDIYMKYYRSQEYYDRSGWRGTWAMDGGGALMNQGIHGVDLLQYIMGPVKSVFAHTRTMVRKIEVEDTASALLEFKNGALGVIQATTSIYPGSPRRLEINGDRGSIVLEEDSMVSWDIQGEEIPPDIQIKKATNVASSDPAAISIEGHLRQMRDMVDAIRNDRKPLVDVYEGRKPIEIIMAIYESSRTGKLVEL